MQAFDMQSQDHCCVEASILLDNRRCHNGLYNDHRYVPSQMGDAIHTETFRCPWNFSYQGVTVLWGNYKPKTVRE